MLPVKWFLTNLVIRWGMVRYCLCISQGRIVSCYLVCTHESDRSLYNEATHALYTLTLGTIQITVLRWLLRSCKWAQHLDRRPYMRCLRLCVLSFIPLIIYWCCCGSWLNVILFMLLKGFQSQGCECFQIRSCNPLCFLSYHFPYTCVLQLWHAPQLSSVLPVFVLESGVSWKSPDSFQSRQILRNQNLKARCLKSSQ